MVPGSPPHPTRWPKRRLRGSLGAFPSLLLFFFFSTFISSDLWLLQPYGVLPQAAVQAMWHFDVSKFHLHSVIRSQAGVDKDSVHLQGWLIS